MDSLGRFLEGVPFLEGAPSGESILGEFSTHMSSKGLALMGATGRNSLSDLNPRVGLHLPSPASPSPELIPGVSCVL